jgi:uncharacterized membrane protein YhhN
VAFELQFLAYATKPLLISCLAAWYWLNTPRKKPIYSTFFFVGLVFSVIGDTLLMLVKNFGEIFFLLGLSSFLFAHINYIIAFFKFPSFEQGIVWQNRWMVLPFAIILSLSIFLLKNGLGKYLLPVTIYSSIIVTMAAFCFNMKNRIPVSQSSPMFIGALLFVFSDMLIGAVKFKYPHMEGPLSGLAIMSTYLLGQYLLTKNMAQAAAAVRSENFEQ